MTTPWKGDHKHSRDGLMSYVASAINDQLGHLPPVQWSVAALFAGAGSLAVNTLPNNMARHKHGYRHTFGRHEFAREAYLAKFPDGVPPHLTKADVVREVNAFLACDPTYKETGLGRITRNTILRAVGLLR
jgi:hypothetical protein